MGKGGHALKCGIQAKEVNQAVYAAGYFPCTLGAELVCTVHVRASCVKHLRLSHTLFGIIQQNLTTLASLLLIL